MKSLRGYLISLTLLVFVLAGLYVVAYNNGVVTSFTQQMGWKDPGPLISNTDIFRLDKGDTPTPADPGAAPAPSGELGDLTAKIPVATALAPGYVREQFTSGWTSTGGCDTRNRVLARDLTDVVKNGDCEVASGTLVDPYTGATINFVRGRATSSAVQIDHVVSLSGAWQLGANAWTREQREAFANDMDNLLASDGPTNGRKSDKGLAEFASSGIMTNTAFECTYALKYAQITNKYMLSWTQADADYATALSGRC